MKPIITQAQEDEVNRLAEELRSRAKRGRDADRIAPLAARLRAIAAQLSAFQTGGGEKAAGLL